MRILIADDHAVVRRGVREILTEAFPSAEFGEAQDCQEVFHQVRKQDWDIVVLDITMPGTGGLEALKELKSSRPELPVLVLSIHPEDQFAVRCMKAGASGYITKEKAPHELTEAIKKIVAGGKYISDSLAEQLAIYVAGDETAMPHEALSDREFQVMRMIASGKTVTEIGGELSLSVKTISTYRARVLDKMRMKTNAELTRYAIENKLVI